MPSPRSWNRCSRWRASIASPAPPPPCSAMYSPTSWRLSMQGSPGPVSAATRNCRCGSCASTACAPSPASKATAAGSRHRAGATTPPWSSSTDHLRHPGSTMTSSHLPLLAGALASLLAGASAAATPAPDADHAAQLAQAREELRRAAAHIAELTRGHGETNATLRARIEQARARALIGVLLEADEEPGVRIPGVTPDGPAAQAGLRGGDRLLSVDGVQILGSRGELRLDNTRRLLGKLQPDRPVRLGYRRDRRDASVTLTPRTG